MRVTKSFESQIKKWREKVEKKVDRTISLFIVDFTNHLIGRTPVGDPSLWKDPPEPDYRPGTLINNWHTTLNVPYAGKLRGPNTSGQNAVGQSRSLAKIVKAGDVVHITNPTPYANLIEYLGWSSQAPQGMVRITASQFFNTRKLRKVYRSAQSH